MNEREPTTRKPGLASNVMLTAVWLFLAALVAGAIWILAGINRAFGGFAVQDASEHPISDFFETVVFGPSRLLPLRGNFLPIALSVFWVFLLCLLASFLYHLVRSRFFRRASSATRRIS